MKQFLLTVCFVVFCGALFAQNDEPIAPNFKDIKRNVGDPTSNFYYPNLMDRYNIGDSTLTIQEKRYLYYGYVFQPTYNPIDTSQYNMKISLVLSREFLSKADYADLDNFADALLTEDPFNLRALNAKLLVCSALNDVEEYKILANKRSIIQNAIISSGDGMSIKTAFYVIKVAHEYDMLPFMGFTFGGVDVIEKRSKCNSLSLSNNRFGIDKMYFNISLILKYAGKTGGKI